MIDGATSLALANRRERKGITLKLDPGWGWGAVLV